MVRCRSAIGCRDGRLRTGSQSPPHAIEQDTGAHVLEKLERADRIRLLQIERDHSVDDRARLVEELRPVLLVIDLRPAPFRLLERCTERASRLLHLSRGHVRVGEQQIGAIHFEQVSRVAVTLDGSLQNDDGRLRTDAKPHFAFNEVHIGDHEGSRRVAHDAVRDSTRVMHALEGFLSHPVVTEQLRLLRERRDCHRSGAIDEARKPDRFGLKQQCRRRGSSSAEVSGGDEQTLCFAQLLGVVPQRSQRGIQLCPGLVFAADLRIEGRENSSRSEIEAGFSGSPPFNDRRLISGDGRIVVRPYGVNESHRTSRTPTDHVILHGRGLANRLKQRECLVVSTCPGAGVGDHGGIVRDEVHARAAARGERFPRDA